MAMIADGKDDNGYYLVATKVEDKNIYLNLKAGETFLSSGDEALVELQEMRQQLSKLLLLH